MDRSETEDWIAEEVERSLPKSDRRRFQELISIEMDGLHSGNIARHRLRLSEFDAWKNSWE